jgi:hypothetical protein
MPNKYDKGGRSSKKDVVKGLSSTEANKREILERLAMPRNKGLVYKAVDGIVTVVTYKKYLRDDPDFAEKAQETIDAMRMVIVEKTEEKIFDAIIEDEQLSKTQADLAKTLVKNLGKDRGWTEKTEIKQEGDGGMIQIQYVQPPQIEDIDDQQTIEIKKEDNEQSDNQ